MRNNTWKNVVQKQKSYTEHKGFIATECFQILFKKSTVCKYITTKQYYV